MVKKLVLVGVLSIAAVAANAAEPPQRGAYIGGAFGSSVFDDDGAFFGLAFDDRDQSFQGHGGYRFFRYFAIEGRYTNYGTFTLETIDLDATAVSAHAVGIIPFGSSGWELFGQFGVGSIFWAPMKLRLRSQAASGSATTLRRISVSACRPTCMCGKTK
jgi:hypothetical protein